MSISRSIRRQLMRARISLNQTINKILEINVKRKELHQQRGPKRRHEALNEELRVLNKIAAQQAKLVRMYEQKLGDREREQRRNTTA